MSYKPVLFLASLILALPAVAEHSTEVHQGEEMVITTSHKLFPNTTIATPKFGIDKADIEKLNAATADDIVRGAPGIQVRRRFIGDTNGVVSTRGSTNFQTAHTMLIQDGIPLSNLTQTKWSGAPRWGLIAPDSVEMVNVLYGPYSAEYSGNSFGSVIDVKTRLPDDFEMHMEAMAMMQRSDRLGRTENLWGNKEFVSAGNRFGDFSVYGFYNHLENEGQPQQWDSQALNPAGTSGDPLTAVTGGVYTEDTSGNSRIITGDSGIEETVSDLYSLKVGYDLNDDLRAIFTVAYEDFERNTGKGDLDDRNYLREADGSTYWGTGSSYASQDGSEFQPTKRSWGSSRYAPSKSERETLSYGLNLSGQLTDNWSIDSSASYFDGYKDKSYNPTYSPLDPAYDGKGEIKDKEIWWATFDVKLATQNFLGNDNLGFMVGYQFNKAYLNTMTYKSDDIAGEEKTLLKQDAGGETIMHSGFAQLDYRFRPDWTVLVGGRLDVWRAEGGHDEKAGWGGYDYEFDNRKQTRFSPKFSLAWNPGPYSARYSFSRAYRFALAQELYESSSVGLNKSIPNPELGPENGNFHDLTFTYNITDGQIGVGFFYNEIRDEIMNTTQQINGVEVSTFLGIDKTRAYGMQMTYKQNSVFELPLDLSLNGTWLDKIIKENDGREELVGKRWVRTSRWKINGAATYHVSPQLDTTVSVNYRGPQFANEDNSDEVDGVYGSSDEYLLVNLKAQYKQPLSDGMTLKLSAGIDNVLNEDYYDYHPYPQRTYFVSVGLDI
jgi:iron complex outermembrane receptor protein